MRFYKKKVKNAKKNLKIEKSATDDVRTPAISKFVKPDTFI